MVLDNDTRGWIMTVVSGIASIICVDLVIRQFPGKKNFKIEDSNTFLSTGLSLSFGVMIFSSLYSMLPSAKKYLIGGGQTPRNATLILIGCFLVGALGISVLSRILHSYIPHSVVDCDHEHGEDEEGKIGDEEAAHSHQSMQVQQRSLPQIDGQHDLEAIRTYGTLNENSHPGSLPQRPSLHTSISSKVTQLVTGAKKECDDNGQCFGYSDTCGTECFRNVLQTRPPRLQSRKSLGNLVVTRPSGMSRNQTTQVNNSENRPLLEDVDESTPLVPTRSEPPTLATSIANIPSANGHSTSHPHGHDHHDYIPSLHKHSRTSSTSSCSTPHIDHDHDHDHDHDPTHHHHVPTNVFLSIGLQTSCAIALHKIPEGFITYATNHANPTLGLSIFLALFIHNITEGFALALPLYLAINSRWKAMLWSTLLGGVSQPLGAGVAALWFRVAGRGQGGDDGPGEVVYGCMFAGTAGIMAMVSLQLLGESLDLTHSRRLCFVSAFAGMGILGLSSALTA
ncbi:Zinc/iron permease [Plenodomus tracheiphilus IPT5]|uniref:Zinc/iron permease n=1 Tax=Plenodomus tracheiphilus IPT5 TaxID=1408161 RepID=A0A6A7BE36_9PLEO|nr:Zinc/iron permease [Plenodomus tracheiphilus IPT5]